MAYADKKTMTFRIDRFLTLYFFHPLFKHRRSTGTEIPILMYHSISQRKRNGVHPYYETTTTPEIFTKQMRFLKEKNYRVIDLMELKERFAKPVSPFHNEVVVTFDDGFSDFYNNAFPILERYEFTATVFLPTDLVGKTFCGLKCLSWNDVRELSKRKISFGSHSKSHQKLINLDLNTLVNEIAESKEKIEFELGKKVKTFSYPYAFPEQNIAFRKYLKNVLIKTGYQVGVTTIIGNASKFDDILFLKRLPINNFDDIDFLSAKIEGGYDWLYHAQYFFKKCKAKKITNRI
jgi:peptidoglycan/xylan/chitin deacetylase (PgdA/CDA1 family)